MLQNMLWKKKKEMPPCKTMQQYQGHPHSRFHNYRNSRKSQFGLLESEINIWRVVNNSVT